MQPLAAGILLREKAMEMFCKHCPQTKHALALQADCRAAAQRHDTDNARIDRGEFLCQLADVLDHLRLAETRQGMEQGDMGGEVIALRREVRVAQAGGPAL